MSDIFGGIGSSASPRKTRAEEIADLAKELTRKRREREEAALTPEQKAEKEQFQSATDPESTVPDNHEPEKETKFLRHESGHTTKSNGPPTSWMGKKVTPEGKKTAVHTPETLAAREAYLVRPHGRTNKEVELGITLEQARKNAAQHPENQDNISSGKFPQHLYVHPSSEGDTKTETTDMAKKTPEKTGELFGIANAANKATTPKATTPKATTPKAVAVVPEKEKSIGFNFGDTPKVEPKIEPKVEPKAEPAKTPFKRRNLKSQVAHASRIRGILDKNKEEQEAPVQEKPVTAEVADRQQHLANLKDANDRIKKGTKINDLDWNNLVALERDRKENENPTETTPTVKPSPVEVKPVIKKRNLKSQVAYAKKLKGILDKNKEKTEAPAPEAKPIIKRNLQKRKSFTSARANAAGRLGIPQASDATIQRFKKFRQGEEAKKQQKVDQGEQAKKQQKVDTESLSRISSARAKAAGRLGIPQASDATISRVKSYTKPVEKLKDIKDKAVSKDAEAPIKPEFPVEKKPRKKFSDFFKGKGKRVADFVKGAQKMVSPKIKNAIEHAKIKLQVEKSYGEGEHLKKKSEKGKYLSPEQETKLAKHKAIYHAPETNLKESKAPSIDDTVKYLFHNEGSIGNLKNSAPEHHENWVNNSDEIDKKLSSLRKLKTSKGAGSGTPYVVHVHHEHGVEPFDIHASSPEEAHEHAIKLAKVEGYSNPGVLSSYNKKQEKTWLVNVGHRDSKTKTPIKSTHFVRHAKIGHAENVAEVKHIIKHKLSPDTVMIDSKSVQQ